ncbi:MAG: hypothetical protein LUC93_02945 [Planctomycetaceae bacterium]|nr:hypothetical protein [Planctomycetaceae bacterium]
MRQALVVAFSLLMIAAIVGCGNPIKRPPRHVFPGSEDYDKRVKDFKISPTQAYDIAHEEASTDRKLQFLSARPTCITGRWYVFSLPQAQGASLNGYHVNGDSGQVKFVTDKTIVFNKR